MRCFVGMPLKAFELPAGACAEKAGRPRPPHQRTKIRDQLERLAFHYQARVQQVQGKLVADEKESVSPVGAVGLRSLQWSSSMLILTPLMNLFKG